MTKRIQTSFPKLVREIENIWIKLSDGTRLAARIWLPEDAEEDPVPAILEYIPYRKRDFTRNRDEPMHAWFAGQGYAAVRVDIRGSGDSDGVLDDEYLQVHELDDACEVIAWLADQPWCSGAVGMMGKSWGGFNALQVAALQPPALKAIITVCSTDDRYADDVHYMGGCLLSDNLWWGSAMLVFNARPPDPAIVGDRWLAMWQERLAAIRPWPVRWMEHARRDAYWQHGSVCEDYGAIKIPVYAVGGWADGYSNAIPRLLQHLDGPRRGLTGPWVHIYPQDGTPAPAMGFLQDAVRWWDRWLKDTENGIDGEQSYRVWMQDSVPPQSTYDARPGRWVAEQAWPSPTIEERRLHLNTDGLGPHPGPSDTLSISSPLTTGLLAGEWCGFGLPGEIASDQRADDRGSLCFDSAPLAERTEILGAPVVELEVAADRPVAQVAVRLNDVAPDGASTRVTYGVLNLTHRDSHQHPKPLVPGERYRVRVQLNDIAHAFPPGHRLRIAVSSSYWPIIWPSPTPVTLTVVSGASTLMLPVRPPRSDDADLPAFDEPETAPDVPTTRLNPGHFRRAIEHDLVTGEIVSRLEMEGGLFGVDGTYRLDPIDLVILSSMDRRYSITGDDPLSARADITQVIALSRDDWHVKADTSIHMWSTQDDFHLEAKVDAYNGEELISSRQWSERVPRDLV
ncbi:MAG: CocE/NonD family hydrolase [Pseudomonadota bacterium]